ncbi:MAG: 30S ribosomal protein S5 [Candidatus Portnoybacteria bacterium]|nr:30S ribosomal protein S5 [Candidatus Portnoybacteria bacterium]
MVEEKKEKIKKEEKSKEVKENNKEKSTKKNFSAFRKRKRFNKKESEFDQKLLDVTRTARMVAGGRRFSFRAVVVIGDRKGRVGVGSARGADVSTAVNKAVRQAKKKLIKIPITEEGSIPYSVEAKYSAARVMLKPAAQGRGVIAGGTVRTICNLAGISNITGKIIGRTNNKLNNAYATIKAFQKID